MLSPHSKKVLCAIAGYGAPGPFCVESVCSSQLFFLQVLRFPPQPKDTKSGELEILNWHLGVSVFVCMFALGWIGVSCLPAAK